MRDNNLKKVLIIGIPFLFVLASCESIIGIKNNELTISENLSNQILPRGYPYFIMLSDYTDGAGNENLWAIQLRFDIDQYVVESEFDNKTLPLVTDQWVEIRLDIDLNNDFVKMYYNGEFLHQKKWSAGPDNEGQGINNLSAVNLFSDSNAPVYFDDFTLEEVGGGIIWSENFDSYDDESPVHGQGGWKGWDNDSEYTAYVGSTFNRSYPHSVDISYLSDIVHVYFGNYSGEFVYSAWIYFPENIAPHPPEITGPESGAVGNYYEYNFVTTDPDLDTLWYYIEWGDGEFENWTGPFASGEELIIGHSWFEKGIYEIRAKARDTLGFESKWSETINVIISNPPYAPTIDGPTSVKKGKEYEFTFNSIDPDGDNVSYFIDWGDGSNVTTSFFYSGSDVTMNHSWETRDEFTIKAKVIDVFNAESEWSNFEIIVPKDNACYFNILNLLIELFPNGFRLIRNLIGM